MYTLNVEKLKNIKRNKDKQKNHLQSQITEKMGKKTFDFYFKISLSTGFVPSV